MTAKRWNPVPEAFSGFTREANFAYRLHTCLHRAFAAGADYAHANPAVMERGLVLIPDDQLAGHFDFVDEEFSLWAGTRRNDFRDSFGLSDEIVRRYFPLPPRETSEGTL